MEQAFSLHNAKSDLSGQYQAFRRLAVRAEADSALLDDLIEILNQEGEIRASFAVIEISCVWIKGEESNGSTPREAIIEAVKKWKEQKQ